jgi:hypothetical protein
MASETPARAVTGDGSSISSPKGPADERPSLFFIFLYSTHGYEPTREAAMAAFAKSWRRE